MQLGFVTAILPEKSLEYNFKFAAQLGYECIEVMCWPRGKAERRYAGVTHIDIDQLNKEELIRIKDLSLQYGVSISALGYYPNPLDPDKKLARTYINHIKKLIRAAAKLGIDRVNTFVGRDWKKSVDDNWPQFMKVWPGIIRLAEDKGIRVGIENCPMLFGADEWPGGKNLATSPRIWERMFNDIPSENFGLNYDPSHMIWQHMDYLMPIRNFADKLFHIHAKDMRVDRHRLDQVGIMSTPMQWYTPKIPGMGHVNWSQFFSVLSDVGYTGPVCVEVEDRAFENTLKMRRRSLELSYRYLRQWV